MASPKRAAEDSNSSSTSSRKRRKIVDMTDEEINQIIENLSHPKISPKVAEDYSNNQEFGSEVQAYAKLAGPNWTFYVQHTQVVIGRSSTPEEAENVQIDLAPAKVVSRKHAIIKYNPQGSYWSIMVLGRNGVKIDDVSYKEGDIPLQSGNILDVGGVQMMFVLPGLRPQVAEEMVDIKTHNHNQVQAQNQNQPQNQTQVQTQIQFQHHQYPQQQQQAYPKGVAIITRSQVPGVEQEEQDLSKDEAKDIKPPYSYATMISQAILSTEEMMMSLSDIYDWISSRYSFYRYSKSGWQNSIRHNLSLNKAFEKVPRKAHEPGKGMKWQITPAFKEEYIQRATNGGKIPRKSRKREATETPPPPPPPPPPPAAPPAPVVAPVQVPPVIPPPQSFPPPVPPVANTDDATQAQAAQPTDVKSPQNAPPAATPASASATASTATIVTTPSRQSPSATSYQNQQHQKQLAYTPDRGSKPVIPSQNQTMSSIRNSTSTLTNYTNTNTKSQTQTPAPQPAHLQLAPPSTSQQLPSSYLPGSSPAQFWKYVQFSTPLREGDSPTKGLSPQPPPSESKQTPNPSSAEKLGDLKDVDLTRGFRQIGTNASANANANDAKKDI